LLRLLFFKRLQKKTKRKKTGEVKSNQMNDENLEFIKNAYKIMDKLEQRISTLEKVLASHAKCIGEMREKKHE